LRHFLFYFIKRIIIHRFICIILHNEIVLIKIEIRILILTLIQILLLKIRKIKWFCILIHWTSGLLLWSYSKIIKLKCLLRLSIWRFLGITKWKRLFIWLYFICSLYFRWFQWIFKLKCLFLKLWSVRWFKRWLLLKSYIITDFSLFGLKLIESKWITWLLIIKLILFWRFKYCLRLQISWFQWIIKLKCLLLKLLSVRWLRRWLKLKSKIIIEFSLFGLKLFESKWLT
jgi:hypothetical protein